MTTYTALLMRKECTHECPRVAALMVATEVYGVLVTDPQGYFYATETATCHYDETCFSVFLQRTGESAVWLCDVLVREDEEPDIHDPEEQPQYAINRRRN